MKWDFLDWGVDVVLSGHDHIYARMEQQQDGAVHYIVNGSGGKSLYACDETYQSDSVLLMRCFDKDYGAMRCSADSVRMILEFFAIDNPVQAVDSLVIYNQTLLPDHSSGQSESPL